MKKFIILLCCFLFVSTNIFAQSTKKTKKKKSKTLSTSTMGDIMGTVLNGLNTEAFENGSTGKSDLISQLSGVKGSDFSKYGTIASELAGALKSTSFMPEWATQKDGVLDKLKMAGSIADVAGGMSGLLGAIDPGAMSSGLLKNKNSLMSALSILSMIK